MISTPDPGALWIVVPAYQAATTIGTVVSGVIQFGTTGIIVVDDGSTDATADAARTAGASVLSHQANRGKGAALRTGIAHALVQGAQTIATLDADGQHDVKVLPRLIEALSTADIVIGSRSREGSAMPAHRRFTNRASAAAVSHIVGVPIPDAQSGFRVFRRAVAELVKPNGDGYEFETEFLVLAARAGFRISSVSVPTIYGAPSHFRLIRDGAAVIRTIWALRR